ncbi:MAG: sulfotransferase [Syntrophobacteraceae bacterium]
MIGKFSEACRRLLRFYRFQGSTGLVTFLKHVPGSLRPRGRYPKLLTAASPKRPLSIIMPDRPEVLKHNLLQSEAALNPANEIIRIKPAELLRASGFSKLLQRIVDTARHELIVLASPSLFLPPDWQVRLECCLLELEKYDPHWGLLGVLGQDRNGRRCGHASTLEVFMNTFGPAKSYSKADQLDGRLLIVRKSGVPERETGLTWISLLTDNPEFPSDSWKGSRYVVNAPVIFDYASDSGLPIRLRIECDRFLSWFYLDRKALRDCLEECEQWRNCGNDAGQMKFKSQESWLPLNGWRANLPRHLLEEAQRPVILLGKGGGGSRLLSLAACDCGINLCEPLNHSLDSMALASAVYQCLLYKYGLNGRCPQELLIAHLQHAAAAMLQRTGSGRLWGFKLPESLLLLPELDLAFPCARFVLMFPDPLLCCSRQPHLTAQPGNPVGLASLRSAYRYAGADPATLLEDSDAVRSAYTLRHQLEIAVAYCRNHFGRQKYYELDFKTLVRDPHGQVKHLAEWLGVSVCGRRAARNADLRRASLNKVFSAAESIQIERLLQPLKTIAP